MQDSTSATIPTNGDRSAREAAQSINQTQSVEAAAHAVKKTDEAVERTVAPREVNVSLRFALLAAAGTSLMMSVGCQMAGKKQTSLFFGQWVPSLLIVALWVETVKER